MPPPNDASKPGHGPADALDAALSRIGDRWALLLVAAMLSGPRRFGDLQAALPGIAPNVLSQRLKHLERQRVIVATPYSRRPPRFAYELTGPGRELAGALRLLTHWGAGVSPDADLPRHGACGTPMEARWWCPTCSEIADDDVDDEIRYV